MLTLISAAKSKFFHIAVQSHWTTVYVHIASQHEALLKHIVVRLLIHSTAIIAEPRRSALNASYVKQDTRRERNVSGFYKTIMGSK